MHIYIHTYILTYIPTYIHTFLRRRNNNKILKPLNVYNNNVITIQS